MRHGGEITQRSTPSARRQLRGVVELAGVGFDRVTSHIYAFHRAVAARSFHPLAAMRAIATGGRITRAVHDGITAGIYTSVRLAGRALFAAATMGMKALESPAPPALAPRAMWQRRATPHGRTVYPTSSVSGRRTSAHRWRAPRISAPSPCNRSH